MRTRRRAAPPAGMARTNLVVAIGTALSRLTGFIRIAALVAVLGRDDLADTFIVANNLPNQIYELLLGGILAAYLVPQFVQYFEQRNEEAISTVVSTAMVALVAMTVLTTAASPLLAQIWSGDRIGDDVTRFGYFLLPQIFFYGCTAVVRALLESNRRFLAAAYAPVLNNVVAIAALVATGAIYDLQPDFAAGHPSASSVAFLGLGTTTGVAIMALGLLPALRGLDIALRWRFAPRSSAVRHLLAPSGWALGYTAANLVASGIVQRLAQRDAGGVTAYTAAFTFFMLPHGLLAVSLVTTFSPDLASAALNQRWSRFVERMTLGLRSLVFLVAPASALLAVLARPLLGLLVRGEFDADDAAASAKALTAFAVGLVGFGTYIFLLRGFYSRKDARTPFILNCIENALNVVGALVAVDRWGVEGLAGSFAFAYTVSAVITAVVLHRTVAQLPVARLLWWFVTVVAGAAWCALAAWATAGLVGADTGLGAVARLAVGGTAGLITYLAVIVGLNALEPTGWRASRASVHG